MRLRLIRNPIIIKIAFLVFFCVMPMLASDGSLAVLQYPVSIRSAGMGQYFEPNNTPTSIYHLTDRRAEVSFWQWIGGVNGLALTVNRLPIAVTVNYLSINDIEYRTEVPSELSQFNFGYSNAAIGLTSGRTLGKFHTAMTVQYLWEKTLDYSARGIDISLSGDFDLTNSLYVTAGFRHAGFISALDQQSSHLPFAVFGQAAFHRNNFGVTGELTTGDFPVKLSGEYTFMSMIHLYGGIQVSQNVNGTGTQFYPSTGFEIDWQTFTLGYAMYQLNHPVNSHQYASIAWRF